MAKQDEKVWFITGASRGLGRALARAVLDRGDVVVGTSRDGSADLDGGDRLKMVALDLAEPGRPAPAIEEALAFRGRIDVLVNNAGVGLLGSVEESDDAEAARLFEVNFFGPLRLIRAALPSMRARRSGHVVNVSSIAGLAPMAGSGLYASTKFALGGMSESLAQEVAPLGIRVTVVEPGAFRTDFLSDRSIRILPGRIDDYEPTSGKVVKYLAAIDGRQLGDPALGARAIIEAVEAPEAPLHLLLGSDALDRARAHGRKQLDEFDRWEALTKGTDSAAGRPSRA